MATPLNQTVTLTQANRLRKRKERDVGQQLNIRTFPKNKGYVAYHDGSWDQKKNGKSTKNQEIVLSVKQLLGHIAYVG